jgi:hypothetical protein
MGTKAKQKIPRLKFMRSVVISLNHPTNNEISIVSNYEVLEAENNRLELEANGAEEIKTWLSKEITKPSTLSTKALKSKRKNVPSATLPAAKPSGKAR